MPLKTNIQCGILGFQGNIEEHESALKRLGVGSKRVFSIEDLETLTHLILPGGESTVMSDFLGETGLGEKIVERVTSDSLSVFGTCAGAILLSNCVEPAKKVLNLKLIEADINRNAYGSQLHSFEVEVTFLPTNESFTATFIRAPEFTEVAEGVKVLAELNGRPILIQQGNVMAATFHPEYLEEPVVHRYFLDNC